MLSPEELTVLDDFRFKVRMPSRAAAVRELLKRGLAAEGYAARGLWREIQPTTVSSAAGRRQIRVPAAGTAGARLAHGAQNAPGNTPPSISRFCPVM